MRFDNIIANPPFGSIGVDIVKNLIKQNPDSNYAMLGTMAMLGKHNEGLALEYVYIGDYVLNPVCKVKWVSQLILLGHSGSCRAIPSQVMEGHRAEIKPNEIRVPFLQASSGVVHGSIKTHLTRPRATSLILSVSDQDYEYIKQHWDGMNIIERFWWLHDHGLYKRFIEQ